MAALQILKDVGGRMYKNILVPMALDHDISPKTLGAARTLAGEDGKITAIHIHEAAQSSVASFLSEDAVRQARVSARARLEEKTKGLPGVTAELVVGHAYRSIIDYAYANGIDCIVIGSHKPGLSDYLLGSTAARVVRHAPCAVHVCRTS
jgi:nucleotide-binding universal stress UspA family protein